MENPHISNGHSNPIFLNDESQPPPYSSIYPHNDSTQHESKLDEPSNSHSLPQLFQNTTEPISYDQLFLSNLNQANRFIFNSDQVIIQPSESDMQNRLRKQFSKQFNKSYLIRHILFISLSSLTLISFQIVLMNNESLLSHTASGLWCGFGNLLTLLSAILAIKYSKLWLLISSIMLHFFCITLNLGALIVINCIATTRYTSCAYQTFNSYNQMVNCNESNLKYGNIAMIVVGATCMLTFTTFFFKLIAVFNNSQTSTLRD